MKITQLMLSKGFGGAERYFVDLSLALADAGHDVQVICHKHFQQIKTLQHSADLQVDTVMPLGWWDILAWKRIKTLLAGFRPDIVQAHLARGAHLAGKACQYLNLPLVVKTHNYVDLKYYSNVTCFVTTTEDQRAYLVKKGISTDRIRVIPNFSSVVPVQNIEITTRKKPVVISYGRFVKKKGFDVLIRAVKLFSDTGLRADLYLGGDGPEYRNLCRLRSQLGLGNQIHFTGWVDDIRSFADKGDIFVLPSRDEPFGIAILEMMALGKPIVATRTQGPMEILDETTACLVDPGNENQLAEALKNVLLDESGRVTRAEKALDVFRTQYAKEIVVGKLSNLYQELSNC